MKSYKIKQKLISFVVVLVCFLNMSFTVCDAAAIDENVNAVVSDGGGIVTESITFSQNMVEVSGTSTFPEGKIIAYTVYKDDGTNKATKANLVKIGETKIQSDSVFSIKFGIKEQDISQKFVLEMKAEKQTEKAKIEITIVGKEVVLAAKIAEVEDLIAECESNGISTDYERVKYGVAKKVLAMLPTFTENGETESYDYNLNLAYTLIDEAKTTLQSYRDGTKTPKAVIRTIPEITDINGKSFYSNTNKKNVFYVGYGHWGHSDLEMYSDLGVNLYHYEIGPKNLLKKAAPVKEWELREVHSNKITYLVEHSSENGGSVKYPSTSGSGQIWLSQTVVVQPNTTYSFGVSFKCASASSLRVQAGNSIKWIYDANNDNEIVNWKTGSSTYTTGADETELTFSVVLHNNSKDLFFDNAYLKDPQGNNLLKNADFSDINTEMFTVNTDTANTIKTVLECAEESGVSVVLLTAMHYFPEYMYTYDTTIANGDVSKFPTFMPFNPTHPEVKKVIDKFLEELIPLVKDSKALHSIALSNEPQFEVNKYPDYYLDKYHTMLSEKYKTVSAMNSAYGTNYGSFGAVSMPNDTGRRSSDRDKLAHFNDYRLFNESIITDYHKAIYDKLQILAPDVLLHTKGMTSMNAIGTSGNRIQLGVNHEELSKFLDLNGCDAWAYYGDEKDTLMGKTMWYDYLTSVKEAPVINAEDHILKDSSTLSRSDAEFNYNMADVWQGAVHGRGATTLWIYDNSDRTKIGTGYYNANLTRRADYLAKIGEISLDLNRLSEEVSAINNKAARVAILYSDSSLVKNPYALNASYIAYQQAMFSGEKVFFVNETTPTTLNEKNIELLIVPCSNYMKAKTLSEIKKHIDDGGKVLLLNANNASWMDENGNAHDTELLQSVISRSESESFYLGNDMYTYDIGSAVVNKIKTELSKLNRPIELTADNNNTEWLFADYEDALIVNICNYGDSDTTINISDHNGFDVANAYDLISGETVGESFIISPNEPKLLKIENINGFKFYNVDENGEKEETPELTTRNMSVEATYFGANPSEAFVQIVAVYEDSQLKQLFYSPAEACADTDGNIASEVSVSIDAGIDLSKCTVKAFLLDGWSTIKPFMAAGILSK